MHQSVSRSRCDSRERLSHLELHPCSQLGRREAANALFSFSEKLTELPGQYFLTYHSSTTIILISFSEILSGQERGGLSSRDDRTIDRREINGHVCVVRVCRASLLSAIDTEILHS